MCHYIKSLALSQCYNSRDNTANVYCGVMFVLISAPPECFYLFALLLCDIEFLYIFILYFIKCRDVALFYRFSKQNTNYNKFLSAA